MPFKDMMHDKISITTHRDGVNHTELMASVQGDKVIFMHSAPTIEPGDEVVRHASNGSETRMIVVDPGFHEAFHGIPAHYQMTVKKWNAPLGTEAGAGSVSYVFHGDNARVNHNSTDNSNNIVDKRSVGGELLAELRQLVLTTQLKEEEREESLEVVDVLDEQFSSNAPNRKTVSALVRSLPPAIAATDLCLKLVELASRISGA